MLEVTRKQFLRHKIRYNGNDCASQGGWNHPTTSIKCYIPRTRSKLNQDIRWDPPAASKPVINSNNVTPPFYQLEALIYQEQQRRWDAWEKKWTDLYIKQKCGGLNQEMEVDYLQDLLPLDLCNVVLEYYDDDEDYVFSDYEEDLSIGTSCSEDEDKELYDESASDNEHSPHNRRRRSPIAFDKQEMYYQKRETPEEFTSWLLKRYQEKQLQSMLYIEFYQMPTDVIDMIYDFTLHCIPKPHDKKRKLYQIEPSPWSRLEHLERKIG